MSVYNTILIAVDLHGNPEQVLARAKTVIENPGISTHILSVSPDPAYIYTSFPAYAGSISTFNSEAQHKKTLAQIQSLAQDAGLSEAAIIAKYGRTTDVILEQAQELAADLIIVGSHGRHGIGLILGSTANGVLHRAKCDVLAVRITKDKVSA
jgi:universal stress protein A